MEDIQSAVHELSWNGTLALATSSAIVQSDRLNARSIYCFEKSENIYDFSLKILMHKKFRLVHDLNKFLKQATETGLINKWSKRTNFAGKSSQFQNYEAANKINTVLVIIWTLMNLSAFAVFIIEIFVDKKVRAKNSAPIWRYIQMSIDPYRYFLLNDWAYPQLTPITT